MARCGLPHAWVSDVNDSIPNDPEIYGLIEECLSPEAVAHWWTLSDSRKNQLIARSFGMVRHVANAHTLEHLVGDDYVEETDRQFIANIERMCLK